MPCNTSAPPGPSRTPVVTRVTKIRRRVPVEEYLKPQKRFAHLFGKPGHPEMLAHIQANADRNIRRYQLLEEEEVIA